MIRVEPPFYRTTCACDEDRANCRKQPGSLIPGDAERIAEFLGEPVEPYLWASPGALLMNSLTRQTFRVGTVTPRFESGKCVFLDEHERCQIHAVAPAGCAYFDVHLSRAEALRRSTWVVAQQADSRYQAYRSTLVEATSYNPTTA